MTRILLTIIMVGFLMFPIPFDKAQKLTKDEFSSALNHMLSFFKIVSSCKNAGYIDMYQEGDNLIFIIECKDKEA